MLRPNHPGVGRWEGTGLCEERSGPMEGDEKLHPGHRSVRLQGFDYRAAGFYFVTICTAKRKQTLGRISKSRIQLSKLGEMALECWSAIPQHFRRARLHAFVIMPNHVHGLVELLAEMGRSSAAPLRDGRPRITPGSLGAIVRSFKGAVTICARKELRWQGDVWERSYFERVLRDGQEIANAAAYVVENPTQWEWDRENPERKIGSIR